MSDLDFNDDLDPDEVADAMEASRDDARFEALCAASDEEAAGARRSALRERNAPKPWTVGEAYGPVPREVHDVVVAERDAARAELESVKNERDLAVLTLAAFTPADKPNQGADAMSITAIGFESREQANGKIAWDIYLDDEHHGGGTSEVSHVAALTAAANYLRDRATSEAGAA